MASSCGRLMKRNEVRAGGIGVSPEVAGRSRGSSRNVKRLGNIAARAAMIFPHFMGRIFRGNAAVRLQVQEQ